MNGHWRKSITIVFLSDISWHGLHQRPHHIAAALAQHWPLLWVQPTTLAEKPLFRPRSVAPNITLVTLPTIPYNARRKLIKVFSRILSYVWPLRRLISLVQRMLFQKALDRLGWHKELCGFVINNFQLASLVKRSDAAFVLYDYIDNVFGFTRLPKHVVAQWRETIRTADLITVTSATLARQLEPHRARDVHIVGNGVEFTFFSEGRELLPPQDLPTGKPIVGYTGAVYPWLDFELLYSVCSPLKSFNFVFIGPIHPEVSTQVRSLSRLENVRFLGFRPYETIPGYVRSFDAGIIPFRKNELTAAVNPVKLYEYCAAGKPTVATAFSQDILQFKDKIFIADSTEDFLAALRKAIEKSRDPSFVACLQEFAYEHRWETKTTLILQLIQHHLKANHPS